MSSISDNENKVRKCRFAIVGAGMAGLGAARTLQQVGINDFLVLEAQDKAGGRIDTLCLGDSVIDLGAQWIHGVDTHVFNVAKENDLLSNKTSNEGQGLYIRNDGMIYNDYLIKRVDFEVGRILENCEKFIDTEEYPSSVGSYLTEQFLQYLCDSPSEDEELKLEMLEWHFRFQEIDNSCNDLNKLSAKEWGQYSCLGKHGQQHINLKNGYGTLTDCFVSNIPKNQLIFDVPIKSIHYTDCGVILTCKNNTKIHAEHAIVTVSIGVLKHCHKTLFHPNLPKSLQTTIEAMGFDGLGKVFLVFESKWWGDNEGIQLVWKKDAQVCEKLQWTKYITGFDPVLNQNRMLLGWVAHKGCEVMECLLEEVVGRNCVDVLRIFFKDQSIPYPIKVYRTTWCMNPYIRGGYSHVTPACDKAGSLGAGTLAQPVLDRRGVPRVILAGEAVHQRHFSTTHGAFESGEDQVRRLVDLLAMKNDEGVK